MNHSKRALYQVSIWKSLDEQQFYPSPSDFGWKMENDRWRPRWTVLPESSRACSELLKCGCEKVVVANVSKPIYHVLSSVVALEAARTQILRNRATNNNHLRYLAEDVKN